MEGNTEVAIWYAKMAFKHISIIPVSKKPVKPFHILELRVGFITHLIIL
jgi:hypothetical protein